MGVGLTHKSHNTNTRFPFPNPLPFSSDLMLCVLQKKDRHLDSRGRAHAIPSGETRNNKNKLDYCQILVTLLPEMNSQRPREIRCPQTGSKENDYEDESEGEKLMLTFLEKLSRHEIFPGTGDETSQTQRSNMCLCMILENTSTLEDIYFKTKDKNPNGPKSSQEERFSPVLIPNRCETEIPEDCGSESEWLSAERKNESPPKVIEIPNSYDSSSRWETEIPEDCGSESEWLSAERRIESPPKVIEIPNSYDLSSRCETEIPEDCGSESEWLSAERNNESPPKIIEIPKSDDSSNRCNTEILKDCGSKTEWLSAERSNESPPKTIDISNHCDSSSCLDGAFDVAKTSENGVSPILSEEQVVESKSREKENEESMEKNNSPEKIKQINSNHSQKPEKVCASSSTSWIRAFDFDFEPSEGDDEKKQQPSKPLESRRLHSKKHSRRPYTDEERSNILKYIISHNEYSRVKGCQMWMEMERRKVCPNRTWQSLKEHYIKNILFRLNSFDFLSDEERRKIERGYF